MVGVRMRHFMVDPDNEERLLKVPRRVVDEIKSEALEEAVQRVEARRDVVLIMVVPGDERTLVVSTYDDAIAAIKRES
jgi:hypothetical protein